MSGGFEPMERHNKVPRGFLALYLALIAWGIGYIAAYTPEISGWSQYRVLKKEVDAEKQAAVGVIHENPYENDPKAVAEGQVIYEETCAGCHGKGLKGDVGPDLTAHLAYGETDGDIYISIAGGRPGGMPAFETRLGRERIWKVLAYIDSIRERTGKH